MKNIQKKDWKKQRSKENLTTIRKLTKFNYGRILGYDTDLRLGHDDFA
jgi:hypothetical protein